jgi:hypothetical protein
VRKEFRTKGRRTFGQVNDTGIKVEQSMKMLAVLSNEQRE